MSRILKYEGFGMQTLLAGLLKGIEEIDTQHELVLLVESGQLLPESLPVDRFQVIPVPTYSDTAFGKLWWDHVAVGRACKKLQIDALYASAHVRPAYIPCPVVVSVFDMMYHRFPQDWPWSDQAYFRLAVSLLTSRATAIAALSKNTKQDILALLSIPEERVEVVYPGVPLEFTRLPPSDSENIRERYDLPSPFILFVGTFHPRKNLLGMLDAFEEIATEIPHDLVIIGPVVWNNQHILRRMRGSRFTDRIRFIGFVPRSDLPLFYNQADLFVFPSLYEGFGFPVLEALACGCATITTNVSSLPEVAGDAAVLVAPGKVEELSNAIRQVLGDTELRARLRRSGLQQAQRFSWSITAHKTIALLEKAAVNGRK